MFVVPWSQLHHQPPSEEKTGHGAAAVDEERAALEELADAGVVTEISMAHEVRSFLVDVDEPCYEEEVITDSV